MAVFRWGHHWTDAFGDLEREVDRLLRSVNLTMQGLRFGRQYPPVNLYELPDEFLLIAELPGVQSSDLEITVASGVLTIRGSRNDSVADETRFRRQERPRGTWQRSLNLPDRIREDAMTAELADGVLRIHLPRALQEQPRQIPVQSG